MGEWIDTTLGDVAVFQRGFDLPVADRKPGSIPVIASTGVVDTHSEAKIVGPGVVIGRSGSIGGGQLVAGPYWPLNTTLWVKDFKGNDERFIYYLVRSLDLSRFNAGSSVPTLNRNHIHPLPIRVPEDLEEQRAIASVLGSLDDKIELNRRMNRTLEQMAQAYFKAWFVDFEPVRAKASGAASFPGMPQPVFDALPTAFANSELGPIPEGWEVKSLGEIADYLNGLALQKYPPDDGPSLPRLKIAQLRKGDTEGAELSNSKMPKKYIVHDGDVIFSWSGSLLVKIWTGGDAALNQHLFKVTSEQYPKWFYYLWTVYHLEDFQRTAASKATTMGHIKRHHLSDAKVVVPPGELREPLASMTSVIQPLLDLMVANNLESRTLAETRDSLLPRLLSGEVRVPLPSMEASIA